MYNILMYTRQLTPPRNIGRVGSAVRMDGQALGRQLSNISVLQILRAGTPLLHRRLLIVRKLVFNCLTALLLYCTVKGAGFLVQFIQST